MTFHTGQALQIARCDLSLCGTIGRRCRSYKCLTGAALGCARQRRPPCPYRSIRAFFISAFGRSANDAHVASAFQRRTLATRSYTGTRGSRRCPRDARCSSASYRGPFDIPTCMSALCKKVCKETVFCRGEMRNSGQGDERVRSCVSQLERRQIACKIAFMSQCA